MHITQFKNQIFNFIVLVVISTIFLSSMLFFFNPRGNSIEMFSSIVISTGLSMVGLGVASYIIRQFFQLNINRKYHVIISGLGTIIMLIGCLIFWIGKLFN